MKYVFRQTICLLALCFVCCWFIGCQQDPTIVEIVYVQEGATPVPLGPSQSPVIRGADPAYPYNASYAPAFPAEVGSSAAQDTEEETPVETVNPLIQMQFPTPSLFPIMTPSPIPTPTLFPTPTPAPVKTPVPTPPVPTSTPISTPTPAPDPSLETDLERELLTAAYEQEVGAIQRKYDSKAAELQSMLFSMEASLAANPEYAAKIQLEIQSVQLQLQQVESHRSQELQAAQTAYQQALAALG